jgi:hypothetical protein
MDPKFMRVASHFSNLYRKVLGDRPSMSDLNESELAKKYLVKARSSNHNELWEAGRELAQIFNMDWENLIPNTLQAVEAPALKKAIVPTHLSENHWSILTACAVKVGGPIANMFVNQAKNADPKNVEEAVDIIAGKLGTFDRAFRQAVGASQL